LIADDGRPVLSDFGISRLLIDSVTIAGTTSLKGNARWMAPELIIPPVGSPDQLHTKATDVWAFGMIVYVGLSKEFRREVMLTLLFIARHKQENAVS
jgi:serine/threonine protein kinase